MTIIRLSYEQRCVLLQVNKNTRHCKLDSENLIEDYLNSVYLPISVLYQ